MGVNEDTIDEIFNERVHYLFNIDELLLERLGEGVPGKKMNIYQGLPYIQGIHRFDSAQKIKVVEQFTAGKYKKFGESQEQISNKEFEPICLRKLRNK